MNIAAIAELLLVLAGDVIKIYLNYKRKRKLELDPHMRQILLIYSQREDILEKYGTSMERVEQQLAEHAKKKKK